MVSQWKKIERYTYLGIAASLIILITTSCISYRNLLRIQREFRWVTQTRENLLNLSYFLSNLKDAEISQREYLLTGQESYLEPYLYVEKVIKQYFANLHLIATDNKIQQKRIDVLEDFVTKKLSELHSLIDLQKDKGAEAAKNALLTASGKEIMDDIKILVLGMDKDEKAMLDQYSKHIASMVRINIVTKVAGVVLILTITMLIISHVNHLFAGYKRIEEKNLELASTDGLTGLFNYRYFFDVLAREILQAKIKCYPVSVIMLDIDHFKNINDSYGHLCGDEILKQMAKIISENVYPLDVVARYGGEEFIILMPGTSSYDALLAVEKLRNIIDHFQWNISDKHISISVSVGLVTIDSHNLLNARDIVEKADTALYSAKRRGRNCVVCYGDSDAGEQQEPDDKIYHELQTKVASLATQLNSQALGVISAFTRTMEMSIRDPYIIHHGENVRIYADAIAEEMQLSAELRERIRIAAMLQDLGKITIPDYILKKTNPLTEDEWKIVKQHPLAAAKILEPLEIFSLEIQMIKHHHEKFDGKGYPAGLKGNQIPIGARILAVADAFDAITSNHDYRPSRSYNSAMKEIARSKGSHFDPDVVDAFCKAIERYKSQIEQKNSTLKESLN